jgi:hypothetical protein
MLTLLGSLIGFLGSIIPEFFKIYQDKQDKSHELQILQMQLEQQKLGVSERLEEVSIKSNSEEYQQLYKSFYSGNSKSDFINSLVRPVIALGFFFLYFLLKLLAYYSLNISDATPYFIVYQTLWTEEDAAIFAGIISFYFGNRAFNKKRFS